MHPWTREPLGTSNILDARETATGRGPGCAVKRRSIGGVRTKVCDTDSAALGSYQVRRDPVKRSRRDAPVRLRATEPVSTLHHPTVPCASGRSLYILLSTAGNPYAIDLTRLVGIG
jgi:hypothetical protein